jgi:hypothetical protein
VGLGVDGLLRIEILRYVHYALLAFGWACEMAWGYGDGVLKAYIIIDT